MKVNGRMIKEKEKANFNGQMETCMKVTGKII